jgi:AraC-like DNA-binding protein
MLSDATVRLLESLGSPADAKVLGPQIVREITYRVLCGMRGGALQALLLMGGTRTQILHILHRMHSDYALSLDVADLADEAGMSVSALHHHFKEVTATSPLRYLKTIRLHKARMLMVQEGMGASIAAERVGYESPSQFSRKFKRLFGAPPVDEAQRVRAMFGAT